MHSDGRPSDEHANNVGGRKISTNGFPLEDDDEWEDDSDDETVS